MAAPQWRQNRLSCAISREQVGHLTMKGMLSEHAEKIDRYIEKVGKDAARAASAFSGGAKR